MKSKNIRAVLVVLVGLVVLCVAATAFWNGRSTSLSETSDDTLAPPVQIATNAVNSHDATENQKQEDVTDAQDAVLVPAEPKHTDMEETGKMIFKNDLVEFLVNTYSSMFLDDYRMLYTMHYAYINELKTDMPPGLGYYAANDFTVYDINDDIGGLLMIHSICPEKSDLMYEFYQYMEGVFVKAETIEHAYCELYENEYGQLILMEDRDYFFQEGYRVSVVEFTNGTMERTPYAEEYISSDDMNLSGHYTWAAWEIIKESLRPVNSVPMDTVTRGVKSAAQNENAKYIGWRDVYANFILWEITLNSNMYLFTIRNEELPLLGINDYVYMYNEGELDLLNDCELPSGLTTYSGSDIVDYVRVIYGYGR